ncbi:hypothetical protein NQ315_014821 [Exocentrus adspersus]|uniref:RNase H type-1 domain-containing protein n=1 Tax=Exocentrus adspersus TaxID=1586481 RepID=A0AAV8VM44_9CUCU|nr:hypothetical protein NQ315_014821 [Exocentrus adspersus]
MAKVDTDATCLAPDSIPFRGSEQPHVGAAEPRSAGGDRLDVLWQSSCVRRKEHHNVEIIQSEGPNTVFRLQIMYLNKWNLQNLGGCRGWSLQSPTVFQAERHAIELCGRELEKRGPNRRSIKIFSDSQAALKALGSYRCTSKAVLNCQQTLSRVGRTNRLTLVWIPGHVDLKGNEVADSLARRGAASEFIGPEPVLSLSYSTTRSVIRTWAEGDTLQYWRGLPGLAHSTRFVPSSSKARSKKLPELSRINLRALIGLYVYRTLPPKTSHT